jgi:hypothetical protein
MDKVYTNQARRAVRSFTKLSKENYPAEFSEEDWDAYYHFFQDAYHLKDWIVNDKNTKITREEMNKFIEENGDMKLLQSIVNSTKHLVLSNPNNKYSNVDFVWNDNSKSEAKSFPSILYEEDSFLLSQDGGHLLFQDGSKIIIKKEEKEIHPKILAVKVLIAWNNFFKERNLKGGFEIIYK